MKFLKKLATICMAITMCFGFGMALTACSDDGSTSSSVEDTRVKYSFYVIKADQTPAVGYAIQLCKADGSCLAPVAVKADGSAQVSITDTSIAYDIHVTKGENNTPISSTSFTIFEFNSNESDQIPANYDGDKITVIITD